MFRSMVPSTYSQCTFFSTIWLVYVNSGGGGGCYLAGYLVKYDSNELVRELLVGSLEDMIRSVKDDNCVAGHIGLQ